MYPPADRAAVEESGTVKWYNAMKGLASSPPVRNYQCAGRALFADVQFLAPKAERSAGGPCGPAGGVGVRGRGFL
jgi:hypothetical protein